MERVLYRKYRSRSLSEVVGQDHITRTLDNAIKSGKIAHAYLFTGPRGVGKTSIARILAHQINDLQYVEDTSNIDIVEIDAASNGGVDEVRELRDSAHILPSKSKYKIYIIDEVHMMSKPAFNALLKTLEEPPAHVIFILATTEVNKLPETIISRTQRFHFRPIEMDDLEKHLKTIAQKEKINISDEAISIIAKQGGGSFRDSISTLDQFSSHTKKVEASDVEDLIGLPSQDMINQLENMLLSSSTSFQDLNNQLNTIFQKGYEANIVARILSEKLRDLIINNSLTIDLVKSRTIFKLLKRLLKVEGSNDPSAYLQIILLEAKEEFGDNGSSTTSASNVPNRAIKTSTVKETKDETIDPPLKQNTSKINVKDHILWEQLLDKIKANNNTLYGIIKMAEPNFQKPNKLTLGFEFNFHQKRVSDPKNKEIILKQLKDISGIDYHLSCEINEKAANKSSKLAEINQIFEGAELFEE